jgi:hypothetical protein
MQAWSPQQLAASATACTPSMLRQAFLQRSDAAKLSGKVISLRSDARRRLPGTPCGETRSANRTRWASGDTDAAASPATSAASGLDRAQLSQQPSALGLVPPVSRVDAMARSGTAERDPISRLANQPDLQPPVPSGNRQPASQFPVTHAEAASLVG